jgi:hypothetical protein
MRRRGLRSGRVDACCAVDKAMISLPFQPSHGSHSRKRTRKLQERTDRLRGLLEDGAAVECKRGCVKPEGRKQETDNGLQNLALRGFLERRDRSRM